MAIYMIDYENVKTGGLNGISRLTEEDSVIIFYSENANRLTFDLHQRLMASRAKIEYREVTVGGHNALDFQLVTYLGYLIAQDKKGQYLIISNDRGFEYVVNFWRKDGLCIGLLPYLKDPAYALQRIARTEPVCNAPAKEEDAAPEEPAEEPAPAKAEAPEEVCAAEALPEEAIPTAEETAEEEENITVEFFAIEEEPAQEEPIPEIAPEPVQEEPIPEAASEPAQEEPIPEIAPEPAQEAAPVTEEAPAPESKPKRRSAPKKSAPKKTAPKKDAAPQGAEKPARKLPAQAELREMLGDSVADDPELRFVMASLEKYKTKLGLNNALVKNFGNQRAGEIYQKVKSLVK